MARSSNLGGKWLSFRRDSKSEYLTVAEVGPVKETVYVYATIEMGPVNPIKYVNGVPQWLPDSAQLSKTDGKIPTPGEVKMGAFVMEEHGTPALSPADKAHFLEIVTLGQKTGDKFVPGVRFGLANDYRIGGDKARVTTWVDNGHLNYFGNHARPNTPHDFKMKLDLNRQRLTVWVSARGDDDWFMLVEDAPLINSVKVINQAQVEQHPDRPPIKLMAQKKPWPTGEKVRPHPLAKKDRAVAPGRDFRFQSISPFSFSNYFIIEESLLKDIGL